VTVTVTISVTGSALVTAAATKLQQIPAMIIRAVVAPLKSQ
jgi:hypothetical protein